MAIRRSACAVRGKATYRLTRKHHPKKHPSGAPLPVAVETSNSPRIKHLIQSGWRILRSPHSHDRCRKNSDASISHSARSQTPHHGSFQDRAHLWGLFFGFLKMGKISDPLFSPHWKGRQGEAVRIGNHSEFCVKHWTYLDGLKPFHVYTIACLGKRSSFNIAMENCPSVPWLVFSF